MSVATTRNCIITRAQYARWLCVRVRLYIYIYMCVCVVKKHACLRLTARKSPRKHSAASSLNL